MEFKLAKMSLKTGTPQHTITLEEILKKAEEGAGRGTFFYLSRENTDKSLKKLESSVKKRYAIIVREVRISMDDKDYIYEVCVL